MVELSFSMQQTLRLENFFLGVKMHLQATEPNFSPADKKIGKAMVDGEESCKEYFSKQALRFVKPVFKLYITESVPGGNKRKEVHGGTGLMSSDCIEYLK